MYLDYLPGVDMVISVIDLLGSPASSSPRAGSTPALSIVAGRRIGIGLKQLMKCSILYSAQAGV